MTDVDIVTDAGRAGELASEWDALAVAAGQPLSAPAWMLGWWRHVAPPGGELRIAAVRRDGRLTGVLPFYRRSPEEPLRLLGDTPSAPATPLAEPGREWEVAAAAVPVLARHDGRPAPVLLAHIPAGSPWTRAVRECHPGHFRPLSLAYGLQIVPMVSFTGTYDAWMASRSTRFRRKLGQLERKFARAGGTSRLATPETLAADVDTFIALHGGRWAGRGTSPLVELGARFRALLLGAGAELVGAERFRLWILEIAGEPVCADLSVAAGGEVVGYNTGWDERFSAYNPTRLSFLRKIEDGFERGDRRLSLGAGMLAYKQSFANAQDRVAWDLIVPVTWRAPLEVARTLPETGRGWAGLRLRRMLTEQQFARLRTLRPSPGTGEPPAAPPADPDTQPAAGPVLDALLDALPRGRRRGDAPAEPAQRA
jgi:CelD/BcsL family acetyltransferase involved in cellulose biosynthesis